MASADPLPEQPEQIVLGFDLDMTLVDSRPGIATALTRMCSQRGYHLDIERAVARIGPPIDVVLAEQLPPEELDEAVRLFRRHLATVLAETGAPAAPPLPGAARALAASRAAGAFVLVLTAKPTTLATATLRAAGLTADRILGARFGPTKTTALTQLGARAYVGDQLSDVAAAHRARAAAVAVATGGVHPSRFREAAAEYVLPDLHGFAELLPLLLFAPDAARR
jgi:phosphoglycolate phosphatase